MKKITSKEEISFKVDGETTLEINENGVLTSNEKAEIVKERLGDKVTIKSTTTREAKSEADQKLKEADEELEKREKESEEQSDDEDKEEEASTSMNREDLDEMAKEKGLEPSDYSNKKEIADAINQS